MSPVLAFAKLHVDSAIRDVQHLQPWQDNSAELADCLNLGRLCLNCLYPLACDANSPEAEEYLKLYHRCQDTVRPWVKKQLPTDGYSDRNTLKLTLDVLYEVQREVIQLREAVNKLQRAKQSKPVVLRTAIDGKEAA